MKYKVTLNGKTYEVEVEKGDAILVNEYEAAAPKAPACAPQAAPVSAPAVVSPAAAAPTGAGKLVSAPIAGTVLTIKASSGQAVKKGEIVLIIEAMKMENEIVAPSDGVLASVLVAKGASVAQGAPLFELK